MRNRLATAAACLSLAWSPPVARHGTAQAPAPVLAPDTSWVARSGIYEVFVRDFSPTGNLRGVIAGLDRIQAVGADVVWLMPIYPVGVANRKGSLGSPYAVRDYGAIEPSFGTPADFRALVEAVHARGMKLILDWVPNHTAFDAVWVREHPDFYVRNERGELSVPRDEQGKLTDWTDVVQLDYRNPDLRRAMIGVMRRWLEEFGIDGFRIDVAGFVPDDFWREAIPALRSAVPRPILLLAEWGDLKMHRLGFDLSYGWDSYSRLKAVWRGEAASTFVERELADFRAMPAGGMRLRFTTNHDETAWDAPPVTLFGGVAGARAAAVAMALLPGRPLLYNGQELESPRKLRLFERDPIMWDPPRAAAARAFYESLLRLARTHPAFLKGEILAAATSAPNDVISYRRGEVLVLVNARPRAVRLTVPGFAFEGTRDLLSGRKWRGTTVTLPAHGAMVLERSPSATPAPTGTRQRLPMDPGWRFTPGDSPGAEAPAFDDRQWRSVDLPHDWSIEGTPRQDAPGRGGMGFFPGGIGWYRKAFRLPAGSRGRQALLEFDGVHMNSDVWINGVLLGRRPFGYVSFAYDITRQLVPGVNVVAVRVDNSRQPNSRWYTGSGIYRHVWLTLAGPLHVGHWGTVVTTPRADSASAEVVIRTRLENDLGASRRGVLRSMVLDRTGREVARAETPFAVAAGQRLELEQGMQVASPRLWSPETPHLYALRSEVLDGARTGDVTTTTFGIRTIAYEKDRGFLLNGRRVKMRGVNLHHDGGGVGAAVPERVWERRLGLLKAMGVNAIRTAHNPPAPEFLDLCDRMGFLVMAEAFDEWTIGKVAEGYHQYFAEWSERDVTDFVRRDRNHPSIVLWSAGNEIGEQTTPEGVPVLRRLLDVFHREDPTRPVTTGNDNIAAGTGPATPAFLNALDIVGYNYVDRWGKRRELFAEQDRQDHPEWKMIGTESGSIFQSFSERYSLGGDPAVVRPNYTSGMLQAERLWKWITMRDWFAGNFMWTGIDYLGESTWPFKGFPSGTLDIIGHPKDSYYLYQSLWTDRPVLHLFPHWSWPGREGQVIPVLAYTNCNIVELFLNGRSLGEKRMEFPAQGTSGGWNSYALPVVNPTTNDLHLNWDVPYQPGVLRAVGKRRDGTVACEAEVRTAGPPAAIRLTVDRDTVSAGPGDVAQVTVEIVDSAGTVVPDADNLVRFTIQGGSIVALDNADLQDHDPYQSDHRHAFNGRALAILRATKLGPLVLTATADGLRPASVRVRIVEGQAPATILPAR